MAKRHKELGKSRAKISRSRPTSRKQEATDPQLDTVYQRIQEILEQARSQLARTVNTEMVRAYWLIGREIVEEEQRGRSGPATAKSSSPTFRAGSRPSSAAGSPRRTSATCGCSTWRTPSSWTERFITRCVTNRTPPGASPTPQLGREDDPVGVLNPDLSWTHYRLLTKVESAARPRLLRDRGGPEPLVVPRARPADQQPAVRAAGQEPRQEGPDAARPEGQEIQGPEDVFKDPVVLEFVGLPESHRLVESELEEALLTNLQAFLLELGKGFAFLARQRRITLDGDHFYVDLVFYHVILKCYVLIDVKSTKLTHGDVGQMQLYVNYFDDTQRTSGDNPTLGLILSWIRTT